jgi:hypothetical protein
LDHATRRTARIAGVWWIVTFVTSIPALLLYDPLLNDADFILSTGAETRIQLGAFLEVGLVISGIATAVVMYPVLKRESQSIALGYVACRIVESCIIAVGLGAVARHLPRRQGVQGLSAAPRREEADRERRRRRQPAGGRTVIAESPRSVRSPNP